MVQLYYTDVMKLFITIDSLYQTLFLGLSYFTDIYFLSSTGNSRNVFLGET